MFNWADQDQVSAAMWAEFNKDVEDHIVPYPRNDEENRLLNFGDSEKNSKIEESEGTLGFLEHASGQEADYAVRNLQDQSALEVNELSTPLDMEPWPDLPSLNAAFGREYNNDSDQDTMTSAYLGDFNASSYLDHVRVQLDGEPDAFCDDQEDKTNSFLDCDWGNIGDFDDFDHLFSTSDSMFANEMVGNGANFLSSSSDTIINTVQATEKHHYSSNNKACADPGLPDQFVEAFGGGSLSDGIVPTSIDKSQDECRNLSGKSTQLCEKAGAQKKAHKLHKKEEKSKGKASRNIGHCPTSSMHDPVQVPLQPAQTLARQQMHAQNIGSLPHQNPFVFVGYGYSAYPVPGIPVMPRFPAESSPSKLPSSNDRTYPDSSMRAMSSEKAPGATPRPLLMTPQEKIEKLRRRQQMQAMLAIKQQQQTLDNQVSSIETSVSLPPTCSPKNQPPDSFSGSDKVPILEPNISVVQDESEKSSVIGDDPLVEEKMYYQLQDALAKLDIKVRLSIRDSLLRLADGVMERQISGDRSSTKKSCKGEKETSGRDGTNWRKRCSDMDEAEKVTNPIDRIVARLLFHRPSDKFTLPVKEEMLTSPPSPNPGSLPL